MYFFYERRRGKLKFSSSRTKFNDDSFLFCHIWCEMGRSKSLLQSAESCFLPSMEVSAPTISSMVAALVILRATGAVVIHHDIHLWSSQKWHIRTAWWICVSFCSQKYTLDLVTLFTLYLRPDWWIGPIMCKKISGLCSVAYIWPIDLARSRFEYQ